VSKANIRSPLTLTIALLLAACSKDQPPAKDVPAAQPPAATSEAAQPHPVPTASPVADVDLTGIEKADGGKTVAEVFAEKDQLAGAIIVIRGKVVKTNAGVMGKNWLHVRDGSGAEGTNDLTVTTASVLPEVGSTVVVSGPLTLDKDFGMGYQYDVIIEDAEVVVE
jgi:hypothetical protein